MERDERTLMVKYCNQPLKEREGSLFEPRPSNQKVVTCWVEQEAEKEADGTGGGVRGLDHFCSTQHE